MTERKTIIRCKNCSGWSLENGEIVYVKDMQCPLCQRKTMYPAIVLNI